ncbi:LIM domain-containing protein [Ditylenchus destructor]|uniref:LIM domain-containing protein n=1 Tax=Ditylenchus destructor TaxID=166010 RepID=A0AAD4NHR3_9BILA|nr:LIM domain-containing protein [Ditylenchus destructor]
MISFLSPLPHFSQRPALPSRSRSFLDIPVLAGPRHAPAPSDFAEEWQTLPKRPPENREHVVSVRPSQPSQRPPFAGVQPETLQHAAAGLRKTEYREPLLARDSQPTLGGSHKLPNRGHWEDFAEYDPLEQHPPRKPIHVAITRTPQSVPIRVEHQYTDPLNGQKIGGPVIIQSAFSPIPNPNNTTSEPPQHSTSKTSFVKELRDQGLTERQKQSNQFQIPYVNQTFGADAIQNLYKETKKYTSSVSDPVNDLIRDMEYKMNTGNYGPNMTSSSSHSTTMTSRTMNSDFCAKCGSQIVGDTPGVTALGNAYHVNCFACDVCQKQLAGCSFYSVDGKNLCQVDYMNSLEKCEKCLTPITQKILRAMGKPWHPECFACPACSKSLDGIPFTVDKEGQPYCLDCYHERFSPRCAVCLKAIAPSGNETEVARVIAMDRSYHVDCYRCEDCGLRLNSKVEGQGCYPLENHLFCKNCNLSRLKSVH